MREILLPRGIIALVSDRDHKRVVAAGPWHSHHQPGRTFYVRRNVHKPDGTVTTEQLHRFILGITDPEILVDHRDGIGLNCTRRNLRVASHSQNAANSRKRHDATSRFRGVCWHKQKQRWQARIKVNGKTLYLGKFRDETEAALAYDTAARESFGAFANCNFPEGTTVSGTIASIEAAADERLLYDRKTAFFTA